jgi:hypothetical protein
VAVIAAPMDSIHDRVGTVYAVTRSPLRGDATVIYYAHAGDEIIARAVVQVFKGCISDVLVYNESNRRKGIASALYRLIEAELGRPLHPSRIRSKAGRAFWANRGSLPSHGRGGSRKRPRTSLRGRSAHGTHWDGAGAATVK